MLSKRENLLETIRGGHPDRFVNQFEAFAFIRETPYTAINPFPRRGEVGVVNAWGITKSWYENQPGAFPDHSPDKVVIKDIAHWRDYVVAPPAQFPAEAWEPCVRQVEKIDRKEQFATLFFSPGVFELCNQLMGMEECLVAFYEEPEAMKELIDFIADWEVAYAEDVCKYLKPDALFHHDDWGSQKSTFFSPEMFREFFVPAYKKIYGYYKAHGVEVIVHHSDSYAATLVPDMIEVGIDIWQGAMTTNNLPDLIARYGGKISIMAGIDSASVDYEGWTPEVVAQEVERACRKCGKLYFIPCQTLGGTRSSFPGVAEMITQEIDRQSKVLF